LWLALTTPGACRLLARDASAEDDTDGAGPPNSIGAVLGLAPGFATVGLIEDGADDPGLAAVALDRPTDAQARGPRPLLVRAFGPSGDAAADRLLAACDAWQAAGRPGAADLRLTVVPRGATTPSTGTHTVVVEKENCCVLVDLPSA
jgi:protein-L-isoaspartate(D-aspartate) O-methyltransferase